MLQTPHALRLPNRVPSQVSLTNTSVWLDMLDCWVRRYECRLWMNWGRVQRAFHFQTFFIPPMTLVRLLGDSYARYVPFTALNVGDVSSH